MTELVDGAVPPELVARPATMRNGEVVHLRPVTTDDGEMLGAFLAGLSEESRAFRFLSAGIDARGAGRELAAADGIGLLAVESDRLIGHACLIPTDPGTAEVAFAIADAEQGHGLATLLLERLVEAAERLGIQRLTAEVDPYNHHMVEVFEGCGLPVDVRAVDGVLHVEMVAALAATDGVAQTTMRRPSGPMRSAAQRTAAAAPCKPS
jgi:RimJ/RimL family protein N-acetyltransferase